MAETVYNLAKARIGKGTLILETDTLKMLLVDSGYTVNPDHDFISSGAGTVGGEEVTGTGYTGGFGGGGRKTLASQTVTEDDTNNRAVFSAANITWTAVNGFTAAAAVLVKEITNDAASLLVAFYDTNFPFTANGGDLTLQVPAAGLITIN